MRHPSLRLACVQPPVIPIVGSWTRETPGTISLGQGIVSYGPPPAALAAVDAAFADPATHQYGPVEGQPDLVALIDAKLRRDNGIDVVPDSRLFVTAGGNMAFMNAVLAVADPGDEVVLVAPFYFNHEMAVVVAGCRPVVVPTDARYQLDPDAIRGALTPRTRAVVTISPNNPTGAVYADASLREVNALCAHHGLVHVHDEAYEYFTYGDARHFSPGSLPGAGQHTISLFSLSKAYGFAGWRVGYMVVPETLADAVNKIQDTILICASLPSQAGAAAALRVGPDHCRPHVVRLSAVRARVLARLDEIGDICEAPRPDGAFYVLLRVRTAMDPFVLTERLIRQHRVAVLPGTAFGDGGCSLRISYGALSPENVEEGLRRLVSGLRALVAS